MTSKATPKAKLKTNGKAAPTRRKPADKETYRSIKDGEIEITERGRRLEKLYKQALS